MNNDYRLSNLYYYIGSGDKFLDRLKFQHGIILCEKLWSTEYHGSDDTFMYYDPIRRKEVYKPTKSRKDIRLNYFYYDVNTKKIEPLPRNDNKRYSDKFMQLNFTGTSELAKNIDDMARSLKLKKLMRRINA